MKRRYSKEIHIGNIAVGGNAPITIQSMLNTKTVDVDGSLTQINELKEVGCDLIRLAVPDEASADAFKIISDRCGLPLIADVHYSYRLAELAIKAGAKKLRMNPGNMSTDAQSIKNLVEMLKYYNIPVRIGVNGGSLDKHFKDMHEADALVSSALSTANIFEKFGFSDLIIAIKASNVQTMIESNRKLAKVCEYPLHLGVTEAGTLKSGLVKSSIGIGTLLEEGIGDTIRVSLSAPVVEEVLAGKTILKALGLRKAGVEVVSCPTCARTEIDVQGLAEKVEQLTSKIEKPLKISVMGCPLNGIGEGESSDIGIAGGKDKSVLLKNGEIFKTIDSSQLIDEFMKLLNEVLQK
ncbi:MAG: flavodoxin-dependent (E)-4-hydroxy-3-methylbut-2-enyl-diphosphate synthase [Clostridia bacterium]|nr:flavodoxin-dependent (E)-4-hydroxy-3-methylbut-2-enyl-diphosphate synthase [Clostridia bacterium]